MYLEGVKNRQKRQSRPSSTIPELGIYRKACYAKMMRLKTNQELQAEDRKFCDFWADKLIRDCRHAELRYKRGLEDQGQLAHNMIRALEDFVEEHFSTISESHRDALRNWKLLLRERLKKTTR